MLLLVTGLPSPRKTQLVDGLARRIGASCVIVGSLPGGHAGDPVLHVHAESDLEAFVEGEWPDKRAAKRAALVVRIDWEPVETCIDRVLQTLHARTVAVET
jgi:hypothetical protein